MTKKQQLIALVAFIGFGFLGHAQERILKTKPNDIETSSIDTAANGQKKASLIDSIQKLLDKEAGVTTIGSLKLKEYAIVFPHEFPVRTIYQLNSIKQQIDSSNTALKAKDSRVTSLKVSVPKTILAKKDTLYTKGNKALIKIVYIDSVRVAISEGVIEYIKVYAQGSSFYNTRSPIPILTMEKRFNDKLYNPYDGSFIFLKDAIYFEGGSRFNYFPDGDAFTIENKRDSLGHINALGEKKLTAGNDLNTLVNLQVYSDLLGVFGNQPNGLIQFEANTKLYLHRGNYRNSYIFKPFDAIEPFFNFSRIDSRFDSIAVSSTQEVNRLELFRRYTYAVGLSINLLRADWRPSNSFEIKAGYMYSSSNLTVGENKTQAALHTPYLEAVLKNKKLNNFGFDLRFGHLWQKLNPNEFIDNSQWNRLVSFKAGVFYFPSKNPSDKIFLRFANYLNLSDRKQDFSQLQLGFSKSISFK